MKWETIRFGDLYEVDSRNGLTKPSKVRGSGYKMINMGELFSNDRIYDIPMELVPLKDNEKKNSKVEVGDLLFARQSLVLEGAGKCCIVMAVSELTVFESHIIRVRLKKELANSLFYYYYFRSPLSPIKTIVSQCAQAGIRASDLQEINVVLPDIKEQTRIADILSTYDNLIENNQKQIKLLEEAAQRLYKEWFVDLRFPGYENTKIVDGVPEGWKLDTIDSLGKIVTGKTPSTEKSEFYGGEIPFVKIPDMQGVIYPIVTEVKLTSEGAKSQSNKYIPKDSVLISCIGTVGLVNISFENCQTNQQINSIILSDPQLLYYTYFAAKQIKAQLEGVGSNGATMTNVNKSKLSRTVIMIPNTDICDKFHNYCKPIFNKIRSLCIMIEKARNTRDMLLPQLMSGKVEV